MRRIGSNGPEVSAIGLGCMGMSFAYGQRDDEGSAATLRRALDIGVTHLDTADMYGFGHNEELIGRVLGDRRDEYVLATKFANRGETDAQGDLVRRWVDSSPQWAREALEDSLRRLRTDRIDLYYMHRRSPDVPIEDTVAAMADFVKQGKVRFIGLSEVSPATLRAAHAVHPISAVQMEYSLFTRFVEDEMLATCRELGVALVAYSPSAAAGSPAPSRPRRTWPPTTSGAPCRASPRRTSPTTRPWCSPSARSPTNSARPPPRPPWPGYWPRATTSCRSPAPNACPTWRRTPPPPTSSSPPTSSIASPPPSRPAPWPANATPLRHVHRQPVTAPPRAAPALGRRKGTFTSLRVVEGALLNAPAPTGHQRTPTPTRGGPPPLPTVGCCAVSGKLRLSKA